MMKVLGLLTAFVLAQSAHAADIAVKGRSYNDCGYPTAVQGDAEVTYKNTELPWGSRVFLVSGLSGTENVFVDGTYVTRALDWRDRQEEELSSTSAWTWSGQRHAELAFRGRNYLFDAVQFVIRVVLPNGESFYDNGGQSRWGYYQAEFPARQCAENEPGLQPLEVRVVNR